MTAPGDLLTRLAATARAALSGPGRKSSAPRGSESARADGQRRESVGDAAVAGVHADAPAARDAAGAGDGAAGAPGGGGPGSSSQPIGAPGGDNLTKGAAGLAQKAEAEMSPPQGFGDQQSAGA